MSVPVPTYIFRFIHIDNLHICLQRQGIYAPCHNPDDGLVYKTIHNAEIQDCRHNKPIPCGQGGVIHDYVPFYFCTRSPMLYVHYHRSLPEYQEGQEPLIYLVSTAQKVAESKIPFVFSDGHGIATYTDWFCDLAHLDKLDWDIINAKYWFDTPDDGDRKRRKQAEFLVYRFCPWSLILGIGVINDKMKTKVEKIFTSFPAGIHKRVAVKEDWYY